MLHRIPVQFIADLSVDYSSGMSGLIAWISLVLLYSLSRTLVTSPRLDHHISSHGPGYP